MAFPPVRRATSWSARRRHADRSNAQPRLAAGAVAIVLSAVMVGTVPAHAAPEPTPVSSTTPTWIFDDDPIDLTGQSPTTQLDVRIPPGWAATGPATVRLDYRYPQLLDTAVIGVSVNGRFVDVRPLADSTGSTTLSIDSEFFDRVDNVVSLESAFTLADDSDCPDPNHPARQIELAPTSRLTMPIEIARAADLADLTRAFEPSGNVEQQLELAVSPDASSAELTAIAHVTGAIRDDSEALFNLVMVDPDSAPSANPRIVAAIDPTVGSDNDVATIATSLSGNSAQFVMVGQDDGALLRAAEVATSGDLAELDDVTIVSPTEATINVEPDDDEASAEPRVIGDTFTLEELGYDTRTLRGPGSDSTTYGFDVALGDAPTSMTVAIDAVRSASSARVDGVALIVNGQRVGTVEFDDDEGRLEDATINVTGADLRPGRNTIKIEADFDDPIDSCGATAPAQDIEISNTTDIAIRAERNDIDLDLDDLPYTFRDPADSDRLVVVLPDDASPANHLDAINLAGLLGGEGAVVKIARADELDADERRAHHLVVLGESDRQPLIDWLIDNGARPAFSSETADAPSSGGPVGVVEIMANPTDERRVVMVATGREGVGATLAAQAILDRSIRGQLHGASATITLADDPEAPAGDPAAVSIPVVESDGTTATAVRRLTSASFDREAEAEPADQSDDSTSTSSSSTSSSSTSTSTSSSTTSTSSIAPFSSGGGGTTGTLTLAAVAFLVLAGVAALVIVTQRRRAASQATATA